MGSLYDYLRSDRDSVYPLLHQYVELGKSFVSASDLKAVFVQYCTADETCTLVESSLANTIRLAQEAAVQAPWIYLALRTGRGEWNYLRFHVEAMEHEEIDVNEYLKFKEHIVSNNVDEAWQMQFDISSFDQEIPLLENLNDVGHGINHLHKTLNKQYMQTSGQGNNLLLEFLQNHKYKEMSLVINERINDLEGLRTSLRFADEYLAEQDQELAWDKVAFQLQAFGFEPGWGDRVVTVRQTIHLLKELMDTGDHQVLEQFLNRLPMLFNILVVAPHGYLGQSAVQGLPDTGGQVIYIFDQVRAMEKEMRKRIVSSGLTIEPVVIVATRLLPEARHTTCNQREERIIGTRNAKILRLPYRDRDGVVVNRYLSRFESWPYLEQFALQLKKEILALFAAKPEQIIGHYSDGNLAASLIARDLDVVQCNIAHTLEKNRYQYSDLNWRELDDRYHFACQYTADLVSINSADMIITSTVQEVAGRENSPGQYESYVSFSLPELYRVRTGLDLRHPKFNVVPPGTNQDIFFPYHEVDRRIQALQGEITSLLYGDSDKTSRGSFEDCNKRIMFVMSRLDLAKNVSGLIEWFATNEELQKYSNLLIVGGKLELVDAERNEEQEEIRKIHRLMDKYKLDGKVRWIGRQLERNLVGELYRFIADMRGIFVQPALFESFGLTILEAMSCGLPVFATKYGGAQETIVDGVSGFHIDPLQGGESSEVMRRFFSQCKNDDQYWQTISDESIERVRGHYTWSQYAESLVGLTQRYMFWKGATGFPRKAQKQYLDMFYGLQFRPLAAAME